MGMCGTEMRCWKDMDRLNYFKAETLDSHIELQYCQLLLNRDGSFDNGIVQVFRTASAGHLHDQPRGRSIELLSSGPIPHWSAPKIEMMQ